MLLSLSRGFNDYREERSVSTAEQKRYSSEEIIFIANTWVLVMFNSLQLMLYLHILPSSALRTL